MTDYESPAEYLTALFGALMFLGFVALCALLVVFALVVW